MMLLIILCLCVFQILLNSKIIDVVDWLKKNNETKITTDSSSNNRLDILVENCGRVNYADVDSPIFNEQRKGK